MAIHYDRNRLGEKRPTSFKIREELLTLVRDQSKRTGAPSTRVVEDALILFFHFSFGDLDDLDPSERQREGTDIGIICNMASDRLCEWLESLDGNDV